MVSRLEKEVPFRDLQTQTYKPVEKRSIPLTPTFNVEHVGCSQKSVYDSTLNVGVAGGSTWAGKKGEGGCRGGGGGCLNTCGTLPILFKNNHEIMGL